MIIPGPSKFRKHPDYKKELKAMIAIHTGLPIKSRKVRAQETKPREQPERELRKNIIKYLRNRGCSVKRIENSITRNLGNGIPDILFFTPVRGFNCYPPSRFYFLELKSDKGTLRPEQKEFKDLCGKSGTGYILARSVDDLKAVCG